MTLLFADIVGSSRLYTELGNRKAEALVHTALEAAAAAVRTRAGKVIKSIGDAVLCAFEQPGDAAAAALALQHEFAASSVSWCVGFHHGAVLRRNGDLFGDAVNVAARICELAKARQILTTEPTVKRLAPAAALRTRPLEKVELPGRPGLIRLHELLSSTADATALADTRAGAVLAHRESRDVLVLSRGADERVLARGGSVMIGRESDCEFVTRHGMTSRTHVKIECRRDRFIATDQSTNGTLIEMDGRSLFLHRDSVPLLGRGSISPGGRQPLPERQRVRFSVRRDSTRVLAVLRPARAERQH